MKKNITLHIVSGFLGAGKTTYVQAMLEEFARRNEARESLERIVYVVNEFGEIGIDAALLTDSSVPSYELANGCICCSLKSEFSLTMRQIISEHQPDRIIFEPSGLFILSEMLFALSGEEFSDRLRIGGIVTIIDAKNFRLHQTGLMSPIIKNQALLADVLIASKMPSEQNDALDKTIDLQLAYADIPIITRDVWEFTPDDWHKTLDRPPRSLDHLRQHTTRRMIKRHLFTSRQHPELTSISIALDTDTMSKPEIEAALNQLITRDSADYGNIIRAKGFVSDRANRAISWLVQVVETQVEWRKIPPREADAPSLIVIIGTDLNEDAIRQILSN